MGQFEIEGAIGTASGSDRPKAQLKFELGLLGKTARRYQLNVWPVATARGSDVSAKPKLHNKKCGAGKV
jgi:hypothetical protein